MKPRALLVSLLLLLLSATVLWAQDGPPAQEGQVAQDNQPDDQPGRGDPPGRVARLQYTTGSVSVQPQGTQDWVEATVNRPLTTSDNIWTDKNSRAELSVGTGILRMDSESSVTFTALNDRTIQVQLHQGTLGLHLRKLYDGEIYEIDTPNMAFTVQKSGDYRFEVRPEGDSSSVTVWKGKGDATGEGPAVRVESKEKAIFSNGTSLTHTFAATPPLDGFDDWAIVRDQREDHYASGRYVSPDTIGAGDLDENGVWSETPDYGPVWVPSHVAVGWAPYRYGHWVWVSPWGWTWVDDASWGFAPFHYGRWVYYNNYWGWAPGPYYARPFYAPALVGWFGGRGWGVSLGFGGGPGYGWCPLGFGEPFFPWYGGSRGYFRSINIRNTRITNINNITNIYTNHGNIPNHFANLRGATAVPERTLLNSQSVSRSMVRVPQGEFNRAPRGQMGLAPTRTSMLGANAGRPAAIPPARSFSRPVFSNVRTSSLGAEGSPNRGGRLESGAIPQRGETNRSVEAQGARPGVGGNTPMRNVPRPPTANSPQSGAIARNNPEGGFSRPGGSSNVPRPPSTMNSAPRSGAIENRNPGSVNRGSVDHGTSSRPMGNNVPRPPANYNGGASHSNGTVRNSPQGSDRGVGSHPSGNEHNVPQGNSGRGADHSSSPENNPRHSDGGHSMNVPRPTGRVLPAGNQSADYRGSQNYGRGESASRGSYPGYGSASRSYPSSPRYSSPSGSQRGSSPSYRSAPSSHSAPSSSSSHSASSARSSGGGGGHSHGRG
jgi:hypothetical protein